MENNNLYEFIGQKDYEIYKLQQRIDKAIEYINHMIEELDKRDMLHPGETKLLSILKGDD